MKETRLIFPAHSGMTTTLLMMLSVVVKIPGRTAAFITNEEDPEMLADLFQKIGIKVPDHYLYVKVAGRGYRQEMKGESVNFFDSFDDHVIPPSDIFVDNYQCLHEDEKKSLHEYCQTHNVNLVMGVAALPTVGKLKPLI